jgi:hypothetical protein
LLITLIATTEAGFKSTHESLDDMKKSLEKKANSEYVSTLEKRLTSAESDVKAARKTLYVITGAATAFQFAIGVVIALFAKH